mgnify:CR=1 FL=1
MEQARPRLDEYTGNRSTTQKILTYFTSLAGQDQRNFDEDLGYLFDHVLEQRAVDFGVTFLIFLAQAMTK